MNHLPFKLAPGSAIVHWLVSSCRETPYAGVSRNMTTDMAESVQAPAFSYGFVNGFVDTGNLPCRDHWLNQRSSGNSWPDTLPEGLVFNTVYCGHGSEQVDFSAFKYLPTLTQRYLRCTLHACTAVSARLRLTTCGIVRIWCDDKPVCESRVQRRNEAQSSELEMEFSAGTQQLTVQLEELHERDTRCFFSLVLLAGEGLSVSWVEDARPELVDAWVTLQALDVYPIAQTAHDVDVQLRHSPQYPLNVSRLSIRAIDRGGLWTLNHQTFRLPAAVKLESGTKKWSVAAVADLPVGALEMIVRARVAEYSLEKKLGLVVLQQGSAIDGESIQLRKQQGLAAIAAFPGYDPSTALALLHAGQGNNVEPALRTLADHLIDKSIETITRRFDCSDFNILSLLGICKLRDKLSESRQSRLKGAILGYRYWLEEGGNDVMWFWSENHALCFHVAQVLAGQFFPDERFSNSDCLGSAVQALGRERLNMWFDAVELNGLAEYNSAAYYPIDILALLSLYVLTTDASLKLRAKKLLDQIFIMIALHTLGGVPAGAQGRAYEKELLAGNATELGPVVAIAFGGYWIPGFDRAAAWLCISGYEPPAIVPRLANPEPEDILNAQYRQGGSTGAVLSLWKCADVQLSTATGYEAGETGHQQHLLDVQFAGHRAARFWINHPGDVATWGEQRPSFLAGNLCLPQIRQVEQSALLLYDLDKVWNPYRCINLYVPVPDLSVERQGNWLILSCADGYLGVWSSSAPECGNRLTTKPGSAGQVSTGIHDVADCAAQQDHYLESSVWQVPGDRIGMFVTVGSARLDGSLIAFKNKCLKSSIMFDPFSLHLQVSIADEVIDLAFTGELTSRAGVIDISSPLSPHYSLNDEPLQTWDNGASRR